MRLIGQIEDRGLAQEFSYFLIKEGVQNFFEPSAQDGEVYLIWVIDEDQVDFATQELAKFKTDIKDPRFFGHYREAKKVEEAQQERVRERNAASGEIVRRTQSLRRPGIVTIILIIVSALILFWSHVEFIPVGKDQELVIAKPPASALLFDFPRPFELFTRVADQYPLQEIEHPGALPLEAQATLVEAMSLPWWKGLYVEFVDFLTQPNYQWYRGPMFEKIGRGEVWRLFTPALLHLDIIHLLFNMIWLYVLGSQVEGRIGWLRYLLLVLIGAAITNVCQYLASGPLFMGMSGVVTILFGFIFTRQRRTPWEGYQLHRVVIAFIVAFIVAMLIFQIVSFGFEVAGRGGVGPPIANTAHIVGLIVGALLGYWDFFAYHEVRGR